MECFPRLLEYCFLVFSRFLYVSGCFVDVVYWYIIIIHIETVKGMFCSIAFDDSLFCKYWDAMYIWGRSPAFTVKARFVLLSRCMDVLDGRHTRKHCILRFCYNWVHSTYSNHKWSSFETYVWWFSGGPWPYLSVSPRTTKQCNYLGDFHLWLFAQCSYDFTKYFSFFVGGYLMKIDYIIHLRLTTYMYDIVSVFYRLFKISSVIFIAIVDLIFASVCFGCLIFFKIGFENI